MARTERKAPHGKFRVIYVDSRDNSEGLEEDFDDVPSAQRCAQKGRPGIPEIKLYIFNDQGIWIGICA